MAWKSYDIEGTFLGLPYDWRRPTRTRVRRRLWNPGGPMFAPKVFGWGLTLNLAHPGSWVLLAGLVVVVLLAV
jgi:hypothetical protein